MKNLCILLLVFSVAIFACEKKDPGTDGPGEIYGRWKLRETLADPGDGSGKYEKVTGKTKYLVVDASGTMSGDALPDLQSFKILDSVRIEVFSKTYMKSLPYMYKVSAKTLTLNPPCFEGCGFRFVRD